MADSNKRKIAEPIDLNDDDPFAELTRIMGFDPRLSKREKPVVEAAAMSTPRPVEAPAVVGPVAVEPAFTAPAPVAAAPAEPAAFAHDDFGIDLEKELMGEFADFEPASPVAARAAPAAPATEPDDAIDIAIEDDFEDAFAASLDEDMVAPVAPVTAAQQPIVAADHAAPSYEAPHDEASFDDAVPSQIDAELDLAPELDLASDFDLAPEFELDDFDLSEPHVDDAPAATTAPAHPAVASVSAADALAEVDMDFTGAFDAAVREDADARDHELAALPAVEPALPTVEPAHQAAAQPAAVSDDALELSLEEELNAMFDGAHPEPAVQSPVVALAPEPAPQQAAASQETRWSALETEAQEPAPPVAPVSGSRRPFIDPAIVGRLASFKATPAPVPAPMIEAAPQPEKDLDDLLDAMEHDVHPDDHVPAAAKQDDEYTASPEAERGEAAYAYQAAPAAQDHDGYEDEAQADYDPAPDVETIDIPETAVAIADDLDIPELAYEQDEPARAAYDDLDADYSRAFAEPAVTEEPASQSTRNLTKPSEDIDFDTDFDSLYGAAAAANTYEAPQTNGHAPAQISAAGYDDARSSAFDEYDEADASTSGARDRFVDLDFDSDIQEELALPAYVANETRAAPQRRGLLIAAVVGGVALLGGVGALALSFGNGSGADAPVVVKADNGPVKVKPENPGGTIAPKQDNKVYDAVKGTDGAGAAPAQEKLVTTSEEPVDMAAVSEPADALPGVTDALQPASDALPGVTDEDMIVPKTEDRVDAAANTDEATAEGIAVAPRRVKTMVVRADGSLAPREDPAPVAAPETTSPETTATTAEAHPLQPAVEPATAAGGDETGAVTSADQAEPTFQSPGADPVPVKKVKTNTITATASVPETGPAVESRPAEQPTEVVGQVQPEPKAKAEPIAPEQVASANVEPAAIAAGSWSVQIASQPSADSAKSTYQDLARRYGSVIGGRGVNIVKADIAGKGTFWRIRVPAKSRDDAIQLCTDYKSAGGNCFVSK